MSATTASLHVAPGRYTTMLNPRQIPALAPWQDVRFGSLADVIVSRIDVRFTPESGQLKCSSRCPLWAKSGREQSQQSNRLFDHLVRGDQQVGRYGQAERLRGLQVDDQFELGRPNNRQIGRLRAFENATNVDAKLSVHVGNAVAIAHKATGCGVLTQLEGGRDTMACCQGDKLIASAVEKRGRAD